MKATKATYDASSIKHLKGAEAVRVQLSLYLGATDTDAITHLAKEVIGNSIDEAASGHGNKICVSIKNNTVTVADFGRGIPVGPHPENKNIDTLELVATELHAGGKSSANNSGYEEGTLGVFGVGLAVVNAVSKDMQIWTFRNKKWWTQSYSKGVAISKVVKTFENDVPKVFGHDKSCGTIVRFSPDFSAFDKGSKLDPKAIVDYITNLSWFVWQKNSKGAFSPIKFTIKINNDTPIIIERKSFSDRFNEICSQKSVEPVVLETPIEIRTKNYDCLLGWTSSPEDLHFAYTNSLYNPLGGTHIQAIKKELKKVIEPIALKKDNFNIDTFLSGAVLIVNVRIKAPKFSSQDKQKLITKEVDVLATDQVLPEFQKWAKKSKPSIKLLLERAKEIGNIIDDSKLKRTLASALKTKNTKGALVWPKGFVQSTTKNPEERELFILEGDSASGLAKQASNRYFQETYGVQGKIPNIIRDDSKAFSNERIQGLLKVIGYDPKAKNPTDNLRVGKIILMTDADDDGPLIGNTPIRLDNYSSSIRNLSLRDFREKIPLWTADLDELNFNTSKIGNVKEGYGLAARKTDSVSKLVELTFDNCILSCSENHLWPILIDDPLQTTQPLIVPIKAKELTSGMKFLGVANNSKPYAQFNTEVIVKPLLDVRTRLANTNYDVFCMTVPKTNTFVVDLENGCGIISYNSHISSLILGLLYVLIPDIFEKGLVYLVDGPLYRYQSKKGEVIYAMTYKELLEKAGGQLNGDVERAKGWGQARAQDATLFAFNPETRSLIQATPENAKTKAEGILSIMGKESIFRKQMLGLS